MALTSISTEEDVVRFHFGESIIALSVESFESGRLADVGSGAGFPGMAIKLFRQNLNVILLEPNKKKCAFLNEIVRKLEFTDVEILPVGFEASRIPPGGLSYVVSRAVGRTGKLLSWSRSTLSVNGRLILWLGASDSTEIAKNANMHWRQIPIPRTARRKIVIGNQQMVNS